MDTRVTANALRRELAKAGLQGCLSSEAFQVLLQHVLEVQGSREVLERVLDVVKQDLQEGDAATISGQQMGAAIRQQQGTTSQVEPVVVVGAFDVPKISYDHVSKQLYADSKWRSTLLPPVQYKQRLYSDRLALLHQRLRRNKRFQPHADGSGGAQLTELMGLKGSLNQRRITMGCIRSTPDGSYSLEDTGGSVPLDLSEAELASGFLTENCVVMAEGVLGMDGVFKAFALGFPSCEPRGMLPATAQKLNFFGAPVLSADALLDMELSAGEHLDERIVFLANVWVDVQSTLDLMEVLLAAWEEMDEVPPMFVMMGNFSSRAAAAPGAGAAAGGGGAALEADDYPAVRAGFTQLGELICRFPRIKAGSVFVFVPGPGDPGVGRILPQPALPSYFTADLQRLLPRAVFTTNPARIRYHNREVVAFRYDLMKAMRRRCLLPPPGLTEQSPPGDAFGHLALTVLQQSLLCPLPLAAQPIHWAHDHALQLYPLPHALVIADASPQASFMHEGCLAFNPGSLQERLFTAYLPFRDDVEPSELPSDTQMR